MKYITIHASATECKPSITRDKIKEWHLAKGWRDIGYHVVIEWDGSAKVGRPLTQQGAHVAGHNKDNIGICMIGGVDRSGHSVMNFNYDQFQSLKSMISYFQDMYDIPDENVKGHRDWSPDLDGDGEIEQNEWLKDCPCFNVREFMDNNERKFK
jgi:hypothetical protein